MEWFVAQFSFVPDATLQKHLAEAFYQARYVGRLREALDLRGGFNNTFVKHQIVLYASIFEAVIDYFLEQNASLPDVARILADTEYRKEHGVFGSKVVLTVGGPDDARTIIPCSEVPRTRELREVRFDQRVAAAVKIGLVSESLQKPIQDLYKDRNNIHIRASAAKDFVTDDAGSSTAFKNMFSFLSHARAWSERRGGE